MSKEKKFRSLGLFPSPAVHSKRLVYLFNFFFFFKMNGLPDDHRRGGRDGDGCGGRARPNINDVLSATTQGVTVEDPEPISDTSQMDTNEVLPCFT